LRLNYRESFSGAFKLKWPPIIVAFINIFRAFTRRAGLFRFVQRELFAFLIKRQPALIHILWSLRGVKLIWKSHKEKQSLHIVSVIESVVDDEPSK
jgi:hypothetical protein